jgi:hypothetical protein
LPTTRSEIEFSASVTVFLLDDGNRRFDLSFVDLYLDDHCLVDLRLFDLIFKDPDLKIFADLVVHRLPGVPTSVKNFGLPRGSGLRYSEVALSGDFSKEVTAHDCSFGWPRTPHWTTLPV